MNKVKAFIERGKDGTYGVYVDLEDHTLDYGVIGDGRTVDEAVADFFACYADMKASFAKDGQEFKEAQFEFHYDIASFLSSYSHILSLAGLSRLTGVNQGLLSHYINGHKKPTPKTVKKIEDAIREFGKQLSQVSFV
ncbi:MAG: helix-turn-helix domain-containing protein [Tannerella sp.]|jgi:hypothetical protein|nr:helix-turn-helix domain-containing protein [Tannerella sp.]